MDDQGTSYEQLFGELAHWRQRVAELETSEAECRQTQERLSASEKKYRELYESSLAADARDLTERKRAEEALGESEGRYHIVSELSSDFAGAFRIDADGTIMREWLTGAYTRITGFAPGEIDTHGIWVTLVHPDDMHVAVRHLQTLYSGQPDVCELRIVTQRGEERWLRNYGRPVWDATQGRVIRIYSASQDITERKRMEAMLRASEERYRRIIETAREGIWMMDAGGKTTFVNRRMADLLGHMTGQMLYAPLYAFIDEKDYALAADLLERCRRGIAAQHEFRFRRRDGTDLWAILEMTPVLDEHAQFAGTLVMVTDITERKQAEEEIRKLNRDLDRRNQELLAINQASRAMASTLDLNTVLQRVIGEVRNLLDAEGVSVLLRDGEELVFAASVGIGSEGLPGTRMPASAGIAGWVLETGESARVGDAQRDPRFYSRIDALTGLSTSHLLAAPLTTEGVTRGVIEAINKAGGAFDPNDLHALESVAASAAIAVENARLYEAAQRELRERNRAEEALRESEQRFRALIEHSADAIALVAANGAIRYESPAATQMSGYQPDELEGHSILEALHPDDQAASIELMARVLRESHAPFTGQVRLKRRDDMWRWVEFTATNLLDEPAVQAIVLNYRDITERKQAEQHILEAERFARATLDALSANVCVLDQDGMILAVNQAWRDFADANPPVPLHYSVGMNYLQVCDTASGPDSAEAALFAAGLRAVMRGESEQFSMEYPCNVPGGEKRWFIAQVTHFAGEGPLRLVVAHENITERKRAEETHSQLAAIVESSQDAIIGKTLEGVILSWNQGAERIYGYTAEQVIGRSVAILFPPGRTDELPQILEKIKYGARVEHHETVRVKKDGQPIYVSLGISPIKDVTGKIIGAATIARDITEQKRAEEELARSREQLRELAEYLQAAREEERTRIAREIHDEFGQALTALKMDLSWLSRRLLSAQRDLSVKVDSMLALVDETVQTVRRIATELRPGLLDDLGLVAAMEWQAQEFAKRTGLICELRLGDQDVALDPDLATAFFRILQEALTNVARHARATRVRVELDDRPGVLTLVVRDNGKGIEPAQVFAPRSLGLMGMRERAGVWGGEVVVEGIPGQGTTVTVRIPIRAKDGDLERLA